MKLFPFHLWRLWQPNPRQPRDRIPLRLVLTIPFMVQTVGTVALVGYLSYRSGQRAVVNLSQQLMEEVGDRTALYLEHTLEVPHLINQLNADALAMGLIPGFDTNQTTVLEQFFLKQIQRFPGVSTIAIANERGGMVGSGQSRSRTSVYRTQGFTKGVFTFSTIDAQGRILQTNTLSQSYDARIRPWYEAPKQAGKATWSPIYQFTVDQPTLGISAGLPIYGGGGRLQGVLATDMTLDRLQQFLAALHISPSGQVMILERSGLLVASSTQQPLFTQTSTQLERVNAANSSDPALRAVITALTDQGKPLELIQTTQQLEIQCETGKQFVQVLPFGDRYGLDWLIIAIVPESDFIAEIQANAQRTVLLSGLALLASIGLGLWVSRYVTQPIYQRNLERQVAEQTQELRESKAQLQVITDSVHGGIAYIDASQRYRFINQTYTIWFDRKKEDILGKTVEEVLEEATYKQIRPYIERALMGERVAYEAEIPFQGNRSSRYVSIVMVPHWGEQQTVEGYYALITDVSDRKTSERSLQRYERIVSATTDAISLVDRQYQYQIVNQAYLDWNQKTYDQIVGHSVSDLVGQAVFETIVQPRLDRSLTGETVQYSEWFEFPRLGRQFLSVTYAPFLETDQTISGVVVSIRNITSIKQVEEALQQSEQLFRSAFESSALGISIRSPSGQYLKVNMALCQILGYTEAELLTFRYQDITHPDDLEIFPTMTLDRLVAGDISHYHQEKRFLHKDGRVVWALVSVSLVRDSQQQPLYFVSQIQDITARKQAEEALRESEERFRSAFQDAPIGMALIGLNEVWLKVNPMLCEILGYGEADLLAMSVFALVHPEDLDTTQQYFEQVRTGGVHDNHIRLRYCCEEGRIAWSLLSLSLVRNSEGQPFYYVAQIQDMTEQYAIDRMKNEFISIVSHELRTPLTAIRGFLGLLDTGIYDNKPERAKRMLRQAIANTERLARLVNDILDLERLSSGKVQLLMEVCDAEDLMRRAVAELQPIADKAGIYLVLQPISVPIWASPDAIIQTLTNLLSNAIKFSPADSQVMLTAEIQADRVLFSVKDQGRGIPSDKLESIFGRFQQVDVSDSRQKGGTGLGLAICQNIVQQHGGNIWAESCLGEGSTFYFTVPLTSYRAS